MINKSHVKGLIAFMDNNNKKKWMGQLYDRKKFSFIYNGVNDKNPNLGYNIEKLYQRYKVTIEFITHIINFKTVSKLDLTFNYNFRLQSFYFVKSEKTTIFILSKRKKGPDE